MITSNAWLESDLETRRAELTLAAQEASHATNYLSLVSAGENGVYASIGENYRYAVFGRDMINVAEDIVSIAPETAELIITTLAKLQGQSTDPKSEEEPGRIHHEYRSLIFNDERIPPSSEEIMRKLQLSWGNTEKDYFIYYGSVDATPRFIRLVDKYVAMNGPEVLDKRVQNIHGTELTIAESLKQAIEWVDKRTQDSPWGLVEYQRSNPMGIANQVWKDSEEGYIHENGEFANVDGGLAAVEVQGYAYDAYKSMARLFPDAPEAEHWQEAATDIQMNTIHRLWMPDKGFFAQGIDRHPKTGEARLIRTLTSNSGLLLDSELLQDLDPAQRARYIEPVVGLLLSPEFATDAGIRCRALQHKGIIEYVDYHGSYAVWPKETSDILRGLRRHDKKEAALWLGEKVVQTIIEAGDFKELFYVRDDSAIIFDWEEAQEHFKNPYGKKLCRPEEGQAWSIAAFAAIIKYASQPLEPGELAA